MRIATIPAAQAVNPAYLWRLFSLEQEISSLTVGAGVLWRSTSRKGKSKSMRERLEQVLHK